MSFIAKIADLPEWEEFPAGSMVFREWDDHNGAAYVIKEGRVRLTVLGRELAQLGRAELFGEMALVTGEPRIATAEVLEPTKLVPLRRENFLVLVREQPTFAIEVMQILAKRLHAADQILLSK